LIPQRVPNPRVELLDGTDVCRFAERWGLEPLLAGRIIVAAGELPFDLWIFSGTRGEHSQEDVSETPFDLSTHADRDRFGCERLSTGADVQPVELLNRTDLVVVAQMGAAFFRAGLRWGGGARVGGLDSSEGPGSPVGVERWHVDLGARAA